MRNVNQRFGVEGVYVNNIKPVITCLTFVYFLKGRGTFGAYSASTETPACVKLFVENCHIYRRGTYSHAVAYSVNFAKITPQ